MTSKEIKEKIISLKNLIKEREYLFNRWVWGNSNSVLYIDEVLEFDLKTEAMQFYLQYLETKLTNYEK